MAVIERIQFNIVKHCNLNCRGCTTFSGLKEKEVQDVKPYIKDLLRLRELFDITNIDLFGGEPLLHPEIEKLMIITRRIFPKSNIHILTNGILLNTMDKNFWNTVRENKIIVNVSLYPILPDRETIKKKYSQIRRKLRAENVQYNISVYKKFIKRLLADKHSEPEKSLEDCRKMNYCVNFHDGKLYHCVFTANLHVLNNRFSVNIPYSGIDIYDTNVTGEEIIKLLNEPSSTCNYCHKKCFLYDWKNLKKGEVSSDDYILSEEEKQFSKKFNYSYDSNSLFKKIN